MHYICFIIKIENSYTIYKKYEKKLYNLTLKYCDKNITFVKILILKSTKSKIS